MLLPGSRSARRLLVPAFGLLAVLACLCAPLAALGAGAAVPIVIVYPLSTGGELARADAGGRFATVMADRIANGGGVTVKPFLPGTERADFLTAARSQGADYYVTGFLTPIGDSITVVSQVVSTYSGTVVWSQSAVVNTFSDAAAQAEDVRRAILANDGRYVASIDAPTPAPDATSQPNAKANEAAISFLGRHGRRGRPAASPAPSPLASGAAIARATPSPQAVPSSSAPAVRVQATSPQTTPPKTLAAVPAFGRGSAFAAFGSTGHTGRSALDRFAPRGRYLASVDGLSTKAERSAVVAQLRLELHAHPASAATWRTGTWSLLFVRARAAAFCRSHAGIGSLYVARVRLSGGGSVRAKTGLTSLDCRGTILRRTSATAVAPVAGAAIVRSVRTAVARLATRPG